MIILIFSFRTQAGPNNTIVVSFVPKEAGKHLIHIKKHGKDVGDSPYVVIVKPEDVAMGKPDASKVKCSGPGAFIVVVESPLFMIISPFE